jgi:ribosomal protein S18 acetylase RimI-like enzyme
LGLPSEPGGIRYATCSADEAEDVASLIGRAFAERDPLALAVGLSPDEIAVFVRSVIRSSLVRDLTLVAREVDSGSLAGVVLGEDAAGPPPDPDVPLSPRFGPLAALFDELAAGQPTWHPESSGRVVHIAMLAVDTVFSGRGIGQQLVETCLLNAAGRGFDQAITEATGTASQHIFRKLGFETVAEQVYADFRLDGATPFATIAEQGGIRAMTRPIASAPS